MLDYSEVAPWAQIWILSNIYWKHWNMQRGEGTLQTWHRLWSLPRKNGPNYLLTGAKLWATGIACFLRLTLTVVRRNARSWVPSLLSMHFLQHSVNQNSKAKTDFIKYQINNDCQLLLSFKVFQTIVGSFMEGHQQICPHLFMHMP